MMLTSEQRWLLFLVSGSGGWMIMDALLSATGWERLMQGMCSGSRIHAPDSAPEWLTRFQCGRGKVTSGWVGEDQPPQVVVTKTQFRRFADALPADVLAEIRDTRHAMQAETARTTSWCHCSDDPARQQKCAEGYAYLGPRHHPNQAEDDEHRRISRELDQRSKAALRVALQLDGEGQMELF